MSCCGVSVLICHQSSHPFAERRVSLEESVKVGRAVAKCKPAANNLIFDCKVLSRNHASLWYQNQKFYLKDTASSNGTFVNNQRLSPVNEESQPREVFSGDVVQFGVDVTENQRQVTHGCIVGTIRLYLPDGTEAIAQHSHTPDTVDCPQTGGQLCDVSITSKQLYELSQYLTEAIHREHILENKLKTLERVVSSAGESAVSGWKSLVEEDRLLSRIEMLEKKLEICLCDGDGDNDGADSTALDRIRHELLKLVDDKERYESSAKEALQKQLEDKLVMMRRLHESEVAISSHEDECNRLQEVCETGAQEINRLATANDELHKEIDSCLARLKDTEEEKCALLEATSNERRELEELVARLRATEVANNEAISDLKAVNESASVQIERLRHELQCGRRAKRPSLENNVFNNNNVITIESMDSAVNDGASDVCSEDGLIKVRKQLDLSNDKNSELSAEVYAVVEQTIRAVAMTESSPPQPTVDREETPRESKPTLFNGPILSTNDSNGVYVEECVIKDEPLVAQQQRSAADAITSHLNDEISALKELLTETRASKKATEEELSRTRTELDCLRSATKYHKKSAREELSRAHTELRQLRARTRHRQRLADDELRLARTELTGLRALTKNSRRSSLVFCLFFKITFVLLFYYYNCFYWNL